MTPAARVLVIKLSALGDVILALPAFAAIRAAHPGAAITLLTTPPFEALARASPYFDEVATDGRPTTLTGWLSLIGRLRRARYDRVYDLQTNDRTNLIFQALRPFPPEWSGVAAGCALPHRNPARMMLHSLERHAQQLEAAGIWPGAPTAPLSAPPPDVAWLLAQAPAESAVAAADPRPTVLLAPGSSAHRPAKRWPAERFAALAEDLEAEGYAIVVIGGALESDLARAIQARAPRARDLTGRTNLFQIAALGAGAALAVGNDTGPMHLIAAAGAPAIVLFSGQSDPALSSPRGDVAVLQAPELADLPVERVLSLARSVLDRPARKPAS
jgi:ADP-heptose:LPS heptosyltransferase